MSGKALNVGSDRNRQAITESGPNRIRASQERGTCPERVSFPVLACPVLPVHARVKVLEFGLSLPGQQYPLIFRHKAGGEKGIGITQQCLIFLPPAQ